MTSLKSHFTSMSSGQPSKLRSQLDRFHRQTLREIKARIKLAKNELAHLDYSRLLSNTKNAVMVYSTSIINGASRAPDTASATGNNAYKRLSNEDVWRSQNENDDCSPALRMEEVDFVEFVDDLLQRVERCCKFYR
ncbi:hypothetical protein X943_000875 [Babesia divergens]|uniref:Uncharacterized protein n=1 Tax=Babesia divergens TaxID=32595 RepID=A0AAD9G6N6_BABDI|nr:hypothetical protein X943_000875 [Babesia divergens]